jgi:hypothetical protein
MPTPVETLETALYDLRLNAEELDNETSEAYLRYVANYPEYLLLFTGDGMPMAPDHKGRRLAPIFTSHTAYDAFHQEVMSEGKLVQPWIATVSGADLFPKLHTMNLDGIVFNCCGPQRPLAFVPRTLEVLVERIGKPLAPIPAKVPDFRALAAKAFPAQHQGEREDLNALWRAALDLEAWHFFVHPKDVGEPYPFITVEGGKRCAFAFTSVDIAQYFAFENGFVKEEKSGVFCIEMKLPGAIDWIERAGANNGEFEVVHFNFGAPGFFCPAAQFKPICRFLKRFDF